MKNYSVMDQALEFLAPYGPDLRNGLTNHAPMAAEALAALGRADATMPWLENYRQGMLPRPVFRSAISSADWRAALGKEQRVADWNVFFENTLNDAPWNEVLARKFSGTIVSSLEALEEFSDFAPVIGLLDVKRDPAQVISDMTETFTRVYLTNAQDVLSTIVFIHSVTGVAALRSLPSYLPETTTHELLRYAWQGSCALYSAFGQSAPRMEEIEPPHESRDTLIDMAVANGDEHVIKFTEACLREYDLNPSPAYLAAARHVRNILN